MAVTPQVSVATGLGTGELLVFCWDDLLRPYLQHNHGVDWFPEIPKLLAVAIAPAIMLVIDQIWGDWRTIVDSRLDKIKLRSKNDVDLP